MWRGRWLGRVPYDEAWELQRALHAGTDDYLLVLEHPPVFTQGVHADAANVLVDPATLGIELVRTDRGGDVTYHGPGQLVGYPIRTVGTAVGAGPRHVHQVEELLIRTLVRCGVPEGHARRVEGCPGIWMGGPGETPRKVAAIGVRTSQGRTLHGFALNVDLDLAPYEAIVPCGIADKGVTSLAAEGYAITMADVVAALWEEAALLWGPFDDLQAVTDASVGTPVTFRAPADRALERRLQRSGVDPAAGLPLAARKPEWLRVPARMGDDFLTLRQDIRDLDLVTVCQEAGCPNIYECWSDGTATFMINGSRCTRACGFCQVDTRRPLPLDEHEPTRVAEAIARMALAHAVITCVARDDLSDGGAGAFAETIRAVRDRSPSCAVEVLISDLKGDPNSLAVILGARPDVLNHNIETVARLQRAVRPSASYPRSLGVLARSAAAGLVTKSGIILGMGETEDEVVATLADLRAVGVDIVTIGQYLRPSASHLPVARWWTPEEFERLADVGRQLGFTHVQSSPLTRSSYHAREAAETAPVTFSPRREGVRT